MVKSLTLNPKHYLINNMQDKFINQKGTIHLVLPVAILAAIAILVSANVQTTTNLSGGNVKGVLVAKNGDSNGSSGSGGSINSGSSGNSSNQQGSNSGPGNSSDARIKHEIRTNDERIKTEIREDRVRIDIFQGGTKTRFQQRGNEFIIKTEIEEEDEDEATGSGEEGDVIQELRAISKFPLRIDLSTNQLIMTTKSGETRVLTVLPAHAVQNMLRAHLKKGLGPKFFQDATPSAVPSATPSATPSTSATPSAQPSATPSGEPSSTPSASPTGGTISSTLTDITILENQIVLDEEDGQIVYKIPAKKHLKVFGIFTVDTDLTGIVSAQTGVLLEEQQSLLARILDLLSP